MNLETTSRKLRKQRKQEVRQDFFTWLLQQPDQMATFEQVQEQFNDRLEMDLILSSDAIVAFDYQGERWLQPVEYHETTFRKKLKKDQRAIDELAWQECIPFCGTLMRPDGTRGKSGRLYVIARTYTLESAARRLGYATGVLRAAAASGELPSFTDPDGKPASRPMQLNRLPAAKK